MKASNELSEIKIKIAPYENGQWYFEALDENRKLFVQSLFPTEKAAVNYASSGKLAKVLDEMHKKQSNEKIHFHTNTEVPPKPICGSAPVRKLTFTRSDVTCLGCLKVMHERYEELRDSVFDIGN